MKSNYLRFMVLTFVIIGITFIGGCAQQSTSTQPYETIICIGPQQALQAIVGQQFPSYSLCKPDVDDPSATCGGLDGASTDPTGGKPPYSFEANGILPPGLTLNLNGLLAGTPTLDGTYNFQICAKDLQTNQGCADFTVVVKEPEIEPGISVDSTSCTVINREIGSEGGPAYDIYTFEIKISGTVTGPVNSLFSVHSNTVGVSDYYFIEGVSSEYYNKKPAYIQTPSWSGRLEDPDSRLIRVQRNEGNPSTTKWESGGFFAVGQGVGGWPMGVQMLLTLYTANFGENIGRITPTVLCSP